MTITPYDTGFAIGSAATGVVIGATKSLADAIDFSQFLRKEEGSKESSQESDAVNFVGLNDTHRDLAEHRIHLAEAMAQLESILQQLQTETGSLSFQQNMMGEWQVQGLSEVRGELEAIIAQSPEWQSAWDEMVNALQELKSRSRSSEDLPEFVEVQETDWEDSDPISRDDIRLVQDDQQWSIQLL